MTAKLPANELDRFLNLLRDGTKGQFLLIEPVSHERR